MYDIIDNSTVFYLQFQYTFNLPSDAKIKTIHSHSHIHTLGSPRVVEIHNLTFVDMRNILFSGPLIKNLPLISSNPPGF